MNKFMVKLPFYITNAFTTNPFEGNPAGVVLNADEIEKEKMQKIAAEIKASETAFVMESDKADYKIRFFSPKKEVSLCGHATIASFHTMMEEGIIRGKKFMVETMAGIINVYFMHNLIFMEQRPAVFRETEVEREIIAKALGIKEEEIAEYPIEGVSTGLFSLKVPINDLRAMEKMQPDFEKIKKVCSETSTGAIFAFTFETVEPQCYVHARCFAPLYGVNEDPVTGTANGALGVYLKKHKLLERNPYRAEQGIEMGRKGIVMVDVGEKVRIGGEACIVISGKIEIS